MFGRRPRSETSPVERPDGPADEAAADLLALLDAIEGSALDAYARHGLPTAPGHYRRRAEHDPWEPLGAQLSAADRWALINAEGGWRYASREALGARESQVEARRASAMLSACRGLRLRLEGQAAVTAQDLADSIRLGAAWRDQEATTPLPTEGTRLSFMAPDEDGPPDPV